MDPLGNLLPDQHKQITKTTNSEKKTRNETQLDYAASSRRRTVKRARKPDISSRIESGQPKKTPESTIRFRHHSPDMAEKPRNGGELSTGTMEMHPPRSETMKSSRRPTKLHAKDLRSETRRRKKAGKNQIDTKLVEPQAAPPISPPQIQNQHATSHHKTTNSKQHHRRRSPEQEYNNHRSHNKSKSTAMENSLKENKQREELNNFPSPSWLNRQKGLATKMGKRGRKGKWKQIHALKVKTKGGRTPAANATGTENRKTQVLAQE